MDSTLHFSRVAIESDKNAVDNGRKEPGSSGKFFVLPESFGVITIVITQLGGRSVVELKVRKFGNSLGVVLPKEVINRLHTGDGEPLFLIEAPEGGYRLTPYDPSFEKKMAKAEDIISRYRNALHVLAK
jgi:putative addiction module antidote